jgi:hypothetical protein
MKKDFERSVLGLDRIVLWYLLKGLKILRKSSVGISSDIFAVVLRKVDSNFRVRLPASRKETSRPYQLRNFQNSQREQYHQTIQTEETV